MKMMDHNNRRVKNHGRSSSGRRFLATRAKTRAAIAVLQEPLLRNDHDLQHHHQNPSPRGHFELMSMPTNTAYHPPNNNDAVPVVRGVVMVRDAAQEWNRRSIAQQANTSSPAVDVAWPILSHGCLCLQCVRTQEIGFTEQCGAFEQILGPGLHCLMWPLSTISGRLSLRVKQLDVTCETRTLDQVFVHISICILYRVAVVHSYEAYYRLVNPAVQLQTYVLDVVRSHVPTLTLEELFDSRKSSRIADAVFTRLQREMLNFGYEITTTLVTNVVPNRLVKDSMNEVMASRFIKNAAPYKSEGLKVQKIKEAEARAEALYLSGVGIAKARQSIACGMLDNIDQWTTMDVRVAHPPTANEVMQVLLISQYLDLLSSLGGGSSSSLLVAHDSFAMPELALHNKEEHPFVSCSDSGRNEQKVSFLV